MWCGILITIAVEFCLLIAYIYVQAKKEIKEEEKSTILMEHYDR